MEEDIKILEELRKELGLYADGNKIKQGIAIEHLIKAYKELEQKNRTRIIGKYGDVSLDELLKEKYIPKSLVKDILDNKSFILFEGYSEFPDNAKKITEHKYIKAEDLQEFLEE